ncbi:MAG: hypothetical protein HY718_01790, partial [Planctomycetes bacterium]|nr:hypothetical protein [Planctomycetota bacterium]
RCAMSDLTLLANQYAASAEFLKGMNSALLRIKKAQFGVGGGEASPAELRRSRDELAQLVEAVYARLSNEAGRTVMVPEELLERLRAEYGTQLSWRLPDLQEAIMALRGSEPLGERALKTLDELCGAADATASASFRRLWRR